MKKIYRDAGHGLPRDPGAVGNGLKEAEVVLTIQQLFDAYLLANYEGFELKATRTDNKTFLELGDRARNANKWNADVFISFHINSASSAATGYEDFVYKNASLGSKSLQNMVHEQVLPVLRKHNVNNRGKKTANYAVLRMTNMPAILTETMFISNPKDAQKLKSIEFLKDFASAYAEGIAKFLGLKAKEGTHTVVPAPSKVDSVIVEKPAKQEVYRKGDSGQAVKGLQQNLIKLGYTLPKYGDDGSYGNETVEAVKAFQRANGLLDDGITGKNTLAKIAELLKAQSTPKQEDLPKVTSLGDKYSFQVKSKVAAGVYKYSNLAEKQKTIGANTIFSVYGYTEGVKAWAVPGGFVQAKDVEPIPVTLRTGGLTKENETEFRSFLKGEGIDSELNVHATGNPSAEITVAGLQLVKVKQFLDVKGWYYK